MGEHASKEAHLSTMNTDKTSLTLDEMQMLPHDFTHQIKVGDFVSVLKDSYENEKFWRIFVGKVTKCETWEEEGPLSAENHGAIDVEVMILQSRHPDTEYLMVGVSEHFCYWKWYETFEVLFTERE